MQILLCVYIKIYAWRSIEPTLHARPLGSRPGDTSHSRSIGGGHADLRDRLGGGRANLRNRPRASAQIGTTAPWICVTARGKVCVFIHKQTEHAVAQICATAPDRSRKSARPPRKRSRKSAQPPPGCADLRDQACRATAIAARACAAAMQLFRSHRRPSLCCRHAKVWLPAMQQTCYVMSCHVMTCHVLSCEVMLCSVECAGSTRSLYKRKSKSSGTMVMGIYARSEACFGKTSAAINHVGLSRPSSSCE